MKRFYVLLTSSLLLVLLCCSCSVNVPDPTDIQTEPTILITEPAMIISAATEPSAQINSTDLAEPEVSSLGEPSGSRLECYYSGTYDDYLNYYIHIPENAVEGMPLIVYLHGDGEVNDPESLLIGGVSNFAINAYGESFPFILLEPNTRVDSWINGNIPELLFELINRVAVCYNVDMDKIILTGHSRGAIGVWDMISTYGGFFSAAVPVSSPHQKDHIDYLKAAEVPVWTFAGDIGSTERWYHKYLAQNVDQISVSGGFGKFTVLKNCDHSDAKVAAYVKETFDWMLAQRRGVIPEE